MVATVRKLRFFEKSTLKACLAYATKNSLFRLELFQKVRRRFSTSRMTLFNISGR
eukprot:UN01616